MDDLNEKYIGSIKASTLEELKGVLGQIDREKSPIRYAFIQKEFESRKGEIAEIVKKPNWKKRGIVFASALAVVAIYVGFQFRNGKLTNNEIEVLRMQLSNSLELKSQVGEFTVLPDQPEFGTISVSLLGKPAEGTLHFKIKASDQSGLVSVDWTRSDTSVTITGIHD